VALALSLRLFVAWRTVVPARDGATYLWMAERVGAGEIGAAFDTVFHPLYSLLTGGLLWLVPGLEPMPAGQLVAVVAAACACWPLQALTAQLHGERAARCTALLYAVGLWFVRYPAECLSEGCFYPLVALWALALLGRPIRPGVAGAAAALAYLVRPEGLLLLVLGALRLRGRALCFLLAAGLPVASLLPLGYAVFGDGPTLTPKAAFNYAVGVGAEPSPLAYYFSQAWRVPGTAFEAIGYAALPLAGLGLWLHRRRGAHGTAARWLLAPLFVQVMVVPLLRSHARFLSGFGLLLLPFSGLALAAILARLPRSGVRSLAARASLWGVCLMPDLARLPIAHGDERLVERRLGEWLRPRGCGSRFIATEMPRLEFFAGQRPGPPRPITRAELLGAASDPSMRFVVVVAPRSHIAPSELEALGLRAVSLPEALSTLAKQRALLVYERP